jgi:hypothetical protein
VPRRPITREPCLGESQLAQVAHARLETRPCITHARARRAHTHRGRGQQAGLAGRGAARARSRTFVEVDVALGLRDGASLRCGRPADGEKDGCHEHGSPGPGHARGPHRRPGHETRWSKRWTRGLICTRRETRPARPLRGFPQGGMQWRAGRRPLHRAPRVCAAVPGPRSVTAAREFCSLGFCHARCRYFLELCHAIHSVRGPCHVTGLYVAQKKLYIVFL